MRARAVRRCRVAVVSLAAFGILVGLADRALADGLQAGRSGALQGSAGGGGSAVPDGEYGCYTYHPSAVYVGGLLISGTSYRSKTGASGRYRLSGGGRVDWLGSPPLGFAVAVLEQVEPYATLRMYAQASDIGNKWKAALCSQKGAGTAGNDAGSNGGGRGTGGGGGGGGFAPGQKVTADFIGVLYPASIVRCDASRCLVDYDDPRWPDEWVDHSRLKRR